MFGWESTRRSRCLSQTPGFVFMVGLRIFGGGLSCFCCWVGRYALELGYFGQRGTSSPDSGLRCLEKQVGSWWNWLSSPGSGLREPCSRHRSSGTQQLQCKVSPFSATNIKLTHIGLLKLLRILFQNSSPIFAFRVCVDKRDMSIYANIYIDFEHWRQ